MCVCLHRPASIKLLTEDAIRSKASCSPWHVKFWQMKAVGAPVERVWALMPVGDITFAYWCKVTGN